MRDEGAPTDAVDTGGVNAPLASWWLEVVYSPDVEAIGLRRRLDGVLTLGRSRDSADLAISDACLSRTHASFRTQKVSVIVSDEGSRNGIKVDGKQVGRAVIDRDAVIRHGDTVVMVSRHGAESAALSVEHDDLVARDPRFVRVCHSVVELARVELPVIVLGETGTGKDVLARLLHARSGRSGPFIPLNMAGVVPDLAESMLFGHVRGAFTGAVRDVPGCFVSAHGGTLFLDESVETPLALQPKLLRVLETFQVTPLGASQSRSVDVRVVAATCSELRQDVAAGTFRRDLYARLAGAVVEVPPLRERRLDIIPLILHFAGQGPSLLTAGFVEAALLHPWPMNVRELRNVATRIAARATGRLERRDLRGILDEIGIPAAPAEAVSGGRPPTREQLIEVLRELNGNVSRAARHYDRDVKQIYRWIERHGLDLDDYR